MKLLFVSDVHGRTDYLQCLIDLAGQHDPDIVIFGGDNLPDGDPADPLGSQAAFVRQQMRRHLVALHQRCPRAQVATILGNHDWHCSCQALENLEQEGLIHVLRPDNRLHVAGVSFLGYSYAPPSPYLVKDFEKLDFPGQPYRFDAGMIWDSRHNRPERIDPAAYFQTIPSIREDLARIAPPDTADWVLVAHSPPYDTDLDVLPGAGHVGCESLRDFILQRQPALSLHGHIHESPGLTGRFWQQLGGTVCVNPGQRSDKLAAILVDLTSGTITLTPLNIEQAAPQPVVLQRSPAGRSA